MKASKEIERNYTALGMYALRLCGDSYMAEDAVQNAVEAVWRQLSRGMEPISLKAYLYRTVHNETLALMRKANLTVSLETAGDMEEISEEEIDTAERDAALWRAIDRLPKKCREVFLLSKRDNLKYAEIARSLNISVKTVEAHMSKALRLLRK